MPAWLAAILADIKPIESTVAGLFQVFEAAKAEIQSGDAPEQKAIEVLSDIITAAPAVIAAVTASTAVPPTPPSPPAA